MSIIERRALLIQQINKIDDEQMLEMLQETLSYYSGNEKDITDGLNNYQFSELVTLVEEPAEKDTIPEKEFRKLFARWNTK